jgi:hypothetical protein
LVEFSNSPRSAVGTDVSAGNRSSQESRIDERLEKGVAHDVIQSPEPLNLIPRQVQTRNFEVL